jgi:hypothetical protein
MAVPLLSAIWTLCCTGIAVSVGVAGCCAMLQDVLAPLNRSQFLSRLSR